MVHLVPTLQTYKATDIAEVVFDAVYKLHGLPERIISDRDSLFTSHFWNKLNTLLGIELRMSSAFHPQTDGATERANRTMTQMLRQCVSPKQRDWAAKLPAIEFAMNSARSSTTGFSPFFLNYGRNPSPMIWKGEEVYPGVRQFAETMKEAIMSAHDAIIASRIQHTIQANRKRIQAKFKEGDLVYLSTKNISMPKGRARKLAPKYLGPFPITKVVKEGATYQLGLSDELAKRGMNRTFHASLLRAHVPNDDRRFPGRLPIQIPGFGEKPDEWIVDRIVTHHGKGSDSDFLIQWKAGDRTWASYREVAHLNALDRYCEIMGVKTPSDLPAKRDKTEPGEEDDIIQTKACIVRGDIKEEGSSNENTNPSSSSYSSIAYSALIEMVNDYMNAEEYRECLQYQELLDEYRQGGPHPGRAPKAFRRYLTKDTYNDNQSRNRQTPINNDPNVVQMPADTLEMIVRALNRKTPTPTHHINSPRPIVTPRPVYHPPKPFKNHHNNQNKNGRGGFNGRGKGQPNRRAKRNNERTEDPRRRNRNNDPANSTTTATGNIDIPIPGPSGINPTDNEFINAIDIAIAANPDPEITDPSSAINDDFITEFEHIDDGAIPTDDIMNADFPSNETADLTF